MTRNPPMIRRVTLAGIAMALSGTAFAADHAEAPNASADPAADLADLFAWTTGDDLAIVLTFAGLTPAIDDGGMATFDRDVLYGIHIDNNGDSQADKDIWVRFGQNADGDWGAQATGIPGTKGKLSGAVENALNDGDVWLWAGIADDPFFFDLTGFQDTVATGSLMFTGGDSLAGTNITTITLQFPYESVLDDDGMLQIWATSGRKQGD